MAAEYFQNRLKSEKSPYLLQHAANPVDWYPWGDEAFAEADRQDKPVFLSIGYSTCHWCHVMAHESFEDPAVADLMNRYFISIKVDREERPDIDMIYMKVCQMLTGRGGWPLTIFMSSDQRPFHAATYIPKWNRFGQIGLMELLPRIADLWQTRRDDIKNAAERIVSALQADTAPIKKEEPQKDILRTAYNQLLNLFDNANGGFGGAPKFPTPQNLLFLLRHWKRSGEPQALFMVEKTLQSMRRGGIYDHIGFGFHRYSIDEKWFLPHFEKMLYDQAMLTYAYTEAFQATGHKIYAETADEILSYVKDRMTSPEGAFYSAEDADSEGEEGKFYLWSWDEIGEILGKEEAGRICAVFNVEKAGNYTDEIKGSKTGKNILHHTRSLAETAQNQNMSEEELRHVMEQARRKLFAEREKRIPPHKDDKILTDWNGLMIAAFAKAGQILDKPDYVATAEKAAAFIMERMRRSDGLLLHRFRDGEAAVTAQIDDYAFFTFGLIELYEATFKTVYLNQALGLTKDLIVHFQDEQNGGLFFTSGSAEPMIVRQKEIIEGAIPSGASVAVWNMLRLGRMTAGTELLDEAWNITSFFYPTIKQSPAAFTQFMSAIDFAFGPSQEVVVVGDPKAEDTQKMLKALRRPYSPNLVVLYRDATEKTPDICRIAPYTQEMRSKDGMATAYVCTNNTCEQPTTDIQTMMTFIEEVVTGNK
ncbi:MAG: thioredoxin domain-containing protein [Deltaproteobacteria bacterium]|nr:thioredoxin domain-containing protein [Deltaproteobacteria bacterium]